MATLGMLLVRLFIIICCISIWKSLMIFHPVLFCLMLFVGGFVALSFYTPPKTPKEEYLESLDDLKRAEYGYKPGEGHIASDGRVYSKKETEDEYEERTTRSLERKTKVNRKMAEEIRDEYWKKKNRGK